MLEVRTKTGVLFLRCSEEEAEMIRHAAKAEHRTISGYILNAVLNLIEARQKPLREPANQPENANRSSTQKSFLT